MERPELTENAASVSLTEAELNSRKVMQSMLTGVYVWSPGTQKEIVWTPGVSSTVSVMSFHV